MPASVAPAVREQVDTLVAGCEHVETRRDLEERIAVKGRLTVKLGIDPTGSSLHLGHAVVLHKIRRTRPPRDPFDRRFHRAHRRSDRP
jgi:tyrosyl-tRNA synthetase